jgi:hypothetical protein
MGITGNSKGVRAAIVVLVLLFIAAGAWCSKAEARDRTTVSYGNLAFGGDFCTDSLVIGREFGAEKWLAGLVTHGTGNCRGEFTSANIGGFVLHQLHFGDRFSIGFGAGIFEHGDIGIGKESILLDTTEPRKSEQMQFAAVISVRAYALNRKLVIDMPLHFSSGKATRFNPGKNLIAVGYRF